MKLREFIGGVLPTLQRELVCERCGERFTCGASLGGCWCAEIKLSDAAHAQLRQQYRDCLCRKCMEAAASDSAQAPT